MLFQLIILAIVFYIVHKISQLLFAQSAPRQEPPVAGQSQSKPLDLADADVEDIDYKELPK
jgi:hypothetical protein